MNVARTPKPAILTHVFIDFSFFYAEVTPRLFRLGVDVLICSSHLIKLLGEYLRGE